MARKSMRLLAALTCSAVLVAACGDDKKSDSTETTSGSTAGSTETTAASETTAAAPEAWAVNTDDCIDPEAANAPITGEIKIGSVMPLTGDTSADEAFKPVKDGWQAYMDYANEQGLLGDVKIVASIEDDQYAPEQTPGAVSKQLDAGVQVFSGIIGSPNNLAVRDTLNEECIPQLANLTGLPAWGTDVADYPWTTGEMVPYNLESRIYMKSLQDQGVKTVGLFYVNTDFGLSYADTIKAEASGYGLEVVSEQTVDPTSGDVTSQLTSLAQATPEAIIAVPLGAGCISFLSALAAKKAETAGWAPLTYVTNTCASALILGIAGEAANGIYSSNNLLDVNDPQNASNESVATYLAYMESKGLTDFVTTATAGWTAAEVTVAALIQAQASPEGLTRASIINAARNMEFSPSLARIGVRFMTDGEADGFPAQSLQVLQYDSATQLWTEIGDLIIDYES